MTRQLFDKQLRELHDDVIALSTMVEEAIERSVRALQTRDIPLSEGVVHADAAINKKRYEIQEMIQTPADVRRITYLIWTSHNLERIADRVTNICERVIFMVTGQLEEINVSRY